MLAVVQRSTCHGTPLDLWRMTKASTPIAATVSIVSRRLSPLLTLDEPAVNVITSADRRLAAVSNDSRVRVESSKNMLQTVRPRKRRHLRVGPGVDLDHVLGEIEEAVHGVDADLGDRAQVLHADRATPVASRRPGRSRRGWSAGSCRRSRGGSAARGGRGRRARRVARRAAARSRRGRRARRAPCGR